MLLQDLELIYGELEDGSPVLDALGALRGAFFGSALLAAGHHFHEAMVELAKPDESREAEYRDRNVPFLESRLASRVAGVHEPHEARLVADALDAARATGVPTHGAFTKGAIERAVASSALRDPAIFQDLRTAALENPPQTGQEKGAKFPTSKAHISVVFHSFRLISGRVIISRNGFEA